MNYTRTEKIIHNKFRARIIMSHHFPSEGYLWEEAWAWTYVYLKHNNKPISEWLRTFAESETTCIGSDVRFLEACIERGRLDVGKMNNDISAMRSAKTKLKYYGYSA